MISTGALEDDGRTLVLTRRFATQIGDVWASITDPERLGRWFGTWSGDPSSGSVMVTMNAEPEPVPPVRYAIHACEPPRLLAVSATDGYGNWRLTAELSELDGATTLVLRQEDLDPGSLPEIGPGWEWYLDRLLAAVSGSSPPTLDDFDAGYMPMSAAYAAMVSREVG